MPGTGLSQRSWPLPSCCWHLATAPQSAWGYGYRGTSGLGSQDPLLFWGSTLCMWAGLPRGQGGPRGWITCFLLRAGLKQRAWLPEAAGDWLSWRIYSLLSHIQCLSETWLSEAGLLTGSASILLEHHWVRQCMSASLAEGEARLPSHLGRESLLIQSHGWVPCFLGCSVFSLCMLKMLGLCPVFRSDVREQKWHSGPDGGWPGSHVGILDVHGRGP